MPLPVQLSLLIGSLLAFVLLAFTLRKRQTWPALLLWLAPVGLMLPLADWTMVGLSKVIPAFAMDGQTGDGWRFGFVCFVLLCAVELSTQRFMTVVAGTGAIRREAQDPPQVTEAAPLAAPSPPTDAPQSQPF